MRKRQSIAAFALAASLIATPALADEFSDRVVLWLEQQGFTHFEIKRTWLGRIKIEAYANGIEREIVINGRTGEILRDYWEVEHDDSGNASVRLLPAPEGIGNSRGVLPVQVIENDEDAEHDDDHSDDDSSNDGHAGDDEDEDDEESGHDEDHEDDADEDEDEDDEEDDDHDDDDDSEDDE